MTLASIGSSPLGTIRHHLNQLHQGAGFRPVIPVLATTNGHFIGPTFKPKQKLPVDYYGTGISISDKKATTLLRPLVVLIGCCRPSRASSVSARGPYLYA
jgi:hypothetical protein